MSAILNSMKSPTDVLASQERNQERLSRVLGPTSSSQPAQAGRSGIGTPPEPMRPAQAGLFRHLLADLRTHNPEVAAKAEAWFGQASPTLSKVDCSRAIDRLRSHLAAPASGGVVAPPSPARKAWDPYADIPTGNYALRGVDDDRIIAYYRVSRSKDGKYVRVSQRASDSLFPVKPWPVAEKVLMRIRENGPRNAAELFGRTIGSCYRCGRSLTDADSREAGIGPDCAGKGMF